MVFNILLKSTRKTEFIELQIVEHCCYSQLELVDAINIRSIMDALDTKPLYERGGRHLLSYTTTGIQLVFEATEQDKTGDASMV